MISLRPWVDGDYRLLELCNTVEMTRYLGGPESPAEIEQRHRKYVDYSDPGAVFVIEADGVAAGSIGYWEHSETGFATVWETGWAVLPEFQGRGVATAAIQELVARVCSAGRHPSLHAFPAVDNPASNALCLKTGFTLVGPRDFEYPKDHRMTCNDWTMRLDQT